MCQLQQLQDELKSKDHTINKFLTTIELRLKDILNKLINQNNCEENANNK